MRRRCCGRSSPRELGCRGSSSPHPRSTRSSSTWLVPKQSGRKRSRTGGPIMRKVLAVVRREFVERVRTRWFWISALLGPIFFAALIFLPYLFSGGRAKRLVVVDGTQT